MISLVRHANITDVHYKARSWAVLKWHFIYTNINENRLNF